MKIAVTGKPGVGKTTLCLKVYEALKSKISIGGFVTREERELNVRTGFRLIDLSTNRSAQLARVGKGKVMVGKYEVLVENFEKFLDEISFDGDLIVIDEVGPMELKSQKFVSIVDKLIEKDNLLFTVHYRANHWLLEKIKKEFRLFVLSEANRNKIAEEIVKIYDH
ncbi:MAG: NTPase [Archaeoglobaceae archaeon]